MPAIPVDEVHQFAALIPAGTAKSAPVTVTMAMPPREVSEIHVRVPPGPSGLMGFQIGMAGQQIFPRNQGQFIITDDEKIEWAVRGQNDSGAWELYGYNTDVYDHTVHVRFLVSLVVPGPSQSPGGRERTMEAFGTTRNAEAAMQVAAMTSAQPENFDLASAGPPPMAGRPAEIARQTIELAEEQGEISRHEARKMLRKLGKGEP